METSQNAKNGYFRGFGGFHLLVLARKCQHSWIWAFFAGFHGTSQVQPGNRVGPTAPGPPEGPASTFFPTGPLDPHLKKFPRSGSLCNPPGSCHLGPVDPSGAIPRGGGPFPIAIAALWPRRLAREGLWRRPPRPSWRRSRSSPRGRRSSRYCGCRRRSSGRCCPGCFCGVEPNGGLWAQRAVFPGIL